jgi:hypothetical protein
MSVTNSRGHAFSFTAIMPAPTSRSICSVCADDFRNAGVRVRSEQTGVFYVLCGKCALAIGGAALATPEALAPVPVEHRFKAGDGMGRGRKVPGR